MRTLLFVLVATLACAFPFVANAQSYGISGGLSYMKNHYLARDPFYQDTTRIGARFEFTTLAKDNPDVRGKYKAIGFESYRRFRDSAVVEVLSERGTHYLKKTVWTHQPIIMTARVGFEIPQKWNEFLMLNIGFGIGMMVERNHFVLDSLQDDEYVSSIWPKSTGTIRDLPFGKPGATTIYFKNLSAEIFAQAFYEFQYFSVFATYSYKTFVGGTAQTELHQSINIGLYYPLKTKS